MPSSKAAAAPLVIEFTCVGCGLSCRAHPATNTIQHQLPKCELFNKTKPIDFVQLSGVGMKGKPCENCKGAGTIMVWVAVLNNTRAMPCSKCFGTGRAAAAVAS